MTLQIGLAAYPYCLSMLANFLQSNMDSVGYLVAYLQPVCYMKILKVCEKVIEVYYTYQLVFFGNNVFLKLSNTYNFLNFCLMLQ